MSTRSEAYAVELVICYKFRRSQQHGMINFGPRVTAQLAKRLTRPVQTSEPAPPSDSETAKLTTTSEK
ncbi:unnamed protein product [Plutella xylostella]|uniref:(diamondback moth) hypothetical protein n=1 Tax=Plutella xylostella TaxID=51655 RepID=A0A8S4G3Q8_PLUXY|nr:unnamed protein product [Plutella xylostella]